jgi:hypothetical protein
MPPGVFDASRWPQNYAPTVSGRFRPSLEMVSWIAGIDFMVKRASEAGAQLKLQPAGLRG